MVTLETNRRVYEICVTDRLFYNATLLVKFPFSHAAHDFLLDTWRATFILFSLTYLQKISNPISPETYISDIVQS